MKKIFRAKNAVGKTDGELVRPFSDGDMPARPCRFDVDGAADKEVARMMDVSWVASKQKQQLLLHPE